MRYVLSIDARVVPVDANLLDRLADVGDDADGIDNLALGADREQGIVTATLTLDADGTEDAHERGVAALRSLLGTAGIDEARIDRVSVEAEPAAA